MVNKSINTYQNKGHKQIMIIFVDFRENIEIKTKLQKIKKIFERAKNEINKKMAQMSRLNLSREINHEALI